MSMLLGIDFIVILVEKNLNMLVVMFVILVGIDLFVSMCVKMGEILQVYVVVCVNGKWVLVSKEVKVIFGGCGG